MWIFYAAAAVPVLIGLVLTILSKKITWAEYIFSSIIAIVMAVVFHLCAYFGMTDDIEIWSGYISNVYHCPAWVEEWQEAIYRTEYYYVSETYYTGTGNNRHASTRMVQHSRRVFSHYETRHDNHSEYWGCTAYYGSYIENRSIDRNFYLEMKDLFGGIIEDGGKQSTDHLNGSFDGGDNNKYIVHNKTKYIYPVTTMKPFENKVKAAPSSFSFPKVPTNAPVYNWPESKAWNQSSRLLGENRINIFKFDQMNSRLAPVKHVNIIIVNFGDRDKSIAKLQEAKWIGGKKNDLVLCYGTQFGEAGTTSNIPTWAYVFSWSESEQCKKNLEKILLTNEINDGILPLIENEIRDNFVAKDWSKFDDIDIEPPFWAYMLYFGLMITIQVGFWCFAYFNSFRKDYTQLF